MIPNNFKHRFMFEFLYDFSVRGKYMFYIFLLYLFLILFNNVKDSHVLYSLMTITAFTAVNAGGLVGGNEGPVTASFAAGEIVAKASGNIGGLVKNGGTLTGCYSTSVLSGTASVTICGISTGSVTANECYFMSDGVSNPGGNLPTSTKVSDAAALIDKIASMNQAVAGSGYKYVENTGTDSARVPLLIQPDE
jgi:hypothetical protein